VPAVRSVPNPAPDGGSDAGPPVEPAGRAAGDVADRAAQVSGAALAGAGVPADAPPGAESPTGETPAIPAGSGTAGETGTESAQEDVPIRDALRVAQLADEVVVVDGHPRYHLGECPTLTGAELVPLPVSAARRAGFTPCSTCTPDRTLLARARARRR